MGLIHDCRDNVWGAEGEDPLSGRIVSDWVGGGASVFLQVEEDVDSHLDWACCWGIWSEVRDGITLNGILLVVQGEENLRDVLEVLNRGVSREDMVPDKEQKFKEGTELDCHVVVCSLSVFLGPEATVEAQLGQVDNVSGLWVGGGGSCGYNVPDDAQEYEFFMLDGMVFNPINFQLKGEAPLHPV